MSSSEINPEDVDTVKYKREIPFRHRLTRCEKILLVLLILVLSLFAIVFAILASTDSLRRLNSGISEKGECLIFVLRARSSILPYFDGGNGNVK